MDLTTTYLGLKLRTPLVPSASPLYEDTGDIKLMDDAGAAAVVLHSLFEEQLRLDRLELHHHLTQGTESFAEAISYFPEPDEFHLGPEDYLENIRHAKAAVDIPIIASLNGTTTGGWIDYAGLIEQGLRQWLEEHEYESVRQMQGSMSQRSCSNPGEFERAQYMRALQSYKLALH
jgi:dihydroorotate dehydrogenase (fumarate)